MSHFLLSTYGPEDGGADGPPTPEQMQTYMERIVQLEEEMAATETFVFGGALQGVDVASVARHRDDAVSMTDGPFAEAKEQIAGSTSSRPKISPRLRCGRARSPVQPARRSRCGPSTRRGESSTTFPAAPQADRAVIAVATTEDELAGVCAWLHESGVGSMEIVATGETPSRGAGEVGRRVGNRATRHRASGARRDGGNAARWRRRIGSLGSRHPPGHHR